MMDNELSNQELVKCVVVGDTAVGKTRLICARACNKKLSLAQLLNTHVPTVWAIDQYRIYKEVLERSWEVVDGVNVSLRLWDTFGDHEKDRRFAYGRSDVVLLCFSIGNPKSLRNCTAMWLPEIRRFCPNTPVLLVGCKNDLRFMYCDETYLSHFKDRSPFVRPTKECDLVMPDQARTVASDLGLPYYETSVLTHYGVNAVFENAIRAALLSRRSQRFWLAGFKRVQRPILQAPFCPPKPCYPDVYVSASCFNENLQTLYARQAYTDVIFITGSVGFSAHRFYIAAAAPSLARLIASASTNDINGSDICTRSSSDCSMVSSVGDSSASGSSSSYCHDETECLLEMDRLHHLRPSSASRLKDWKLKRRCSFQMPSSTSCSSDQRSPPFVREMCHPAVRSVSVEQCQGIDHRGRPCVSTQTVVTLTKIVTPNAMRQCLCFIYTGQIDTRFCSLQEIRQAAEFLDIPELMAFIQNVRTREEFLNGDIRQQYRQVIKARLLELSVKQGLYADVHFLLDDGSCPAHRPLLMVRCDVMGAMFAGDFRESSAKVVQMPGVSETTFRQLLHYLYTDRIPPLQPSACIPLVELANRLCLTRLVQLVESHVACELQRIIDSGGEVTLECLSLLEPCQIHNADQLADWCLTYLSTNYNTLCRKAPKVLKNLHPENQAYLAHHRWPPVWYLKERDYYEKYVAERQKEEGSSKALKRSRNNSGCLCFAGKTRRSDGSTYHAV